MSKDELNQKLYQKISDEFEDFEDNLLDEDPREMLESAYGYLIRQDILSAMEDIELPEKECRALLSQDNSLECIYEKWLDHDFSYMDEIRNTISCTATQIVRDEFLKSNRDAR